MTELRFRRPLLIIAAGAAVLSLTAVGVVMAMALSSEVPPVWVTATALYGLPASFLLMLLLVIESVAARRRSREPDGR
ncbi:hypothetical protein [Arthrobacter sp. H16F315]|uniref:hypothetical protein n=1 Tax=Arthrobacter sp. H16F315 TaxID=2955314 RepID=UPI00209763EE|nr:hypothetical protein [Arthrobacter sp. H16F315]MDD1475617.1 hypothetical protein [Arthrobacter sp. H16F315]